MSVRTQGNKGDSRSRSHHFAPVLWDNVRAALTASKAVRPRRKRDRTNDHIPAKEL